MPCHRERMLDGFLNLLKPPGLTSHDLVEHVRRSIGGKVGHTGTLDPAAAGVLVVALGKATRLSQYVQSLPKSYRAEFTLGLGTDTHDAEGTLTDILMAVSPSLNAVREALAALTGELKMVPPAYSAAHVQGRRAYELAREGQHVELDSRTVEVYRADLVDFSEGCMPRLIVDVDCSMGTYIRSLAVMLGQQLGTAAFLSALLRTAVGGFTIEQAVTLPELDRNGLGPHMLSPSAGLAHLPARRLDNALANAVLNGNAIPGEQQWPVGTMVRLLGPGGDLLAVAECVHDDNTFTIQPRTVLPQ